MQMSDRKFKMETIKTNKMVVLYLIKCTIIFQAALITAKNVYVTKNANL